MRSRTKEEAEGIIYQVLGRGAGFSISSARVSRVLTKLDLRVVSQVNDVGAWTFGLANLSKFKNSVCSGPCIGMLLKLSQDTLGGFMLAEVSDRSVKNPISQSRRGLYIRTRSVVERVNNLVEKLDVKLLVEVQDALHGQRANVGESPFVNRGRLLDELESVVRDKQVQSQRVRGRVKERAPRGRDKDNKPGTAERRWEFLWAVGEGRKRGQKGQQGAAGTGTSEAQVPAGSGKASGRFLCDGTCEGREDGDCVGVERSCCGCCCGAGCSRERQRRQLAGGGGSYAESTATGEQQQRQKQAQLAKATAINPESRLLTQPLPLFAACLWTTRGLGLRNCLERFATKRGLESFN